MADIANDLEPPLETNQEELDVQTFNSINDDGGGPSIGDIAEEEEKKKKKNLYNDEYDLDEENPLAGSDDEEDDIQVTIGKIEPINVQFSLKHTTHERHHGTKLDVDAVPTINDQPIYDVDLAQMEDRPWRKPGADITDYFNYGFTEETWNTYCERQKKLRTEFTSQAAVNKALFSNIYLANPLAMPAMNRPTTVIDGSSNVKVLTDNGGRFKAHLHSKDEPVMRTVIGTAPVSGPPGVGSSGAPPPIDFSKPPPGMPPPVQVPPSGLPPATTDMPPGTDGPPGVGSTSVDAPPGVDMPQNTIPTVGAPNTMDMSMPPPGFNPALPPPGMSARPPPIGLPTVAIGAGFNTMMPPPPNFNVRYPMNLPGGMGRPPPLMGREFDSRRDSRDEDDDRRHGRRRSRSRSPRRSDRRRDERDDRRDRDRDRKERDRDRGDRSNRRRSRSRDERERRRDRKDEDSDRKRSRRHDDEDDRRERRERRKKEEKDRSPDKDSQGRASNDEEDKDL